MTHSEYQLYLEEQQRQKAVELEKELEEKRQLKIKKDSLKTMSKPQQRNS